MTPGRFRFDRFVLDPHDRQLRRDDVPVDMNARYLDALTLMVREPGKLISKDRFMDEVWRGVPVTDEALTQCIRSLRKQLGDSATHPRFIETVVKHGYRFIAPVEVVETSEPASTATPRDWRGLIRTGVAGTLGAGVAGLLGGLLYGFAAAAPLAGSGLGTISVLLVIICLTLVVAVLGGAGVAFGIAAVKPSPLWRVIGGATGGLIIGAVVKLIGLDTFNLLFGQSPGAITGAPEGAVLGGAIGLATGLSQTLSLRRAVALAALSSGTAGALITLLGGHMMAGSLVLIGQQFPTSRLRLDPVWSLFGESGFGPISQVVTGGLEGALFGGCIVGAIWLSRRNPASA